jgi:hypothetical protein
MITKETLNLKIVRNSDGSLTLFDFNGERLPIDDGRPTVCVGAVATSVEGRFHLLAPFSREELAAASNDLENILEQQALHIANRPSLIHRDERMHSLEVQG